MSEYIWNTQIFGENYQQRVTAPYECELKLRFEQGHIASHIDEKNRRLLTRDVTQAKKLYILNAQLIHLGFMLLQFSLLMMTDFP